MWALLARLHYRSASLPEPSLDVSVFLLGSLLGSLTGGQLGSFADWFVVHRALVRSLRLLSCSVSSSAFSVALYSPLYTIRPFHHGMIVSPPVPYTSDSRQVSGHNRSSTLSSESFRHACHPIHFLTLSSDGSLVFCWAVFSHPNRPWVHWVSCRN